jgi:zinc ribbon protein
MIRMRGSSVFWVGLAMLVLGMVITIGSLVLAEVNGGGFYFVSIGLIVAGILNMVRGAPALFAAKKGQLPTGSTMMRPPQAMRQPGGYYAGQQPGYPQPGQPGYPVQPQPGYGMPQQPGQPNGYPGAYANGYGQPQPGGYYAGQQPPQAGAGYGDYGSYGAAGQPSMPNGAQPGYPAQPGGAYGQPQQPTWSARGCWNCGNAVAVGAQVCSHCGAPQKTPTQQVWN